VIAILFPPNLIVNNPIIKTETEEIIAGIILITNIESPKKNFHTERIQMDKGG